MCAHAAIPDFMAEEHCCCGLVYVAAANLFSSFASPNTPRSASYDRS